MRRATFPSEFLFHYLPAMLSIGVTTVLLYLLRNTLGTPVILLLYLLPVGGSASLWGLGAGIIAALSAFLTFNYFFIQPNFTFIVHSPGDLIVLFVFLIVSVAISQLVGRARAAQALAVEKAHLTEIASRAKVLEESDRLKSALLSSVSHELRTPLATIKAAVTSLRSGEVSWDSKAREELLEAVEDETDHLNILVGNLLNMSRIEANALQPERQWNLLSEIVAAVIARLHHPVGDHKIVVDIQEEFPLVPVDFLQMEQVFTNLITNSFKYAPGGTTIRISAHTEGEAEVKVRVENQSPPVPEEDLERIFEKFHRITAADRITGTGLGLSICKGIIEAHDGRIWAENLADGFAINFVLPLSLDGKLPPKPPFESEA
jgi:two-component system sensor histidine kinase KdpD